MSKLSIYVISLLLLVWGMGLCAMGATTVNPTDKYAYGANIGWVNAEADVTNGLVLGEAFCSGYLYGANVGWIHAGDGSPSNGLTYANTSAVDYGVNLETDGSLRGFAYGANIGWVQFENTGDPRVNLLTGDLSGFAYGANVGWISLSNQFARVTTDSLQPGPDTDNDMLPDPYELTYTNTITVLDGMGGVDTDGDGTSDKDEYLAGTDPTDAASLLRITGVALRPLDLESDVTWGSVPTRLYRVEMNDDLGLTTNWVDSGLGDVPPEAGTETTETAPFAPPPDDRNYRIQAIRPLAP